MWKMVGRPAGGVPRLRRSRVFAYVTRPLRAGLTYAAPPALGRAAGARSKRGPSSAQRARLFWDDNENRDEGKTAKCVGIRSLAGLRDDNVNRSNGDGKSPS